MAHLCEPALARRFKMSRSPRRLRSPRVLRQTPIDAFQQISQLRGRDRHHAVRRRWPDEAAALQSLGEQAHALAIVPKNLDQSAPPPAEHEQVSAVRIAPERLLHPQRQPVEALAHVGVPGRQPHPRAGRKRDHRCRAIFASAAISADTVAGSAAPAIRTRAPPANSISIIAGAAAAPGTIATGEKPAAAPAGPHNCCRQPNSWLVWIPAARATSDATAPGSSVAATIRSFSARDHRRRRCTDVITSTECLVIVLVLGLALGLAANAQPRKTAFTGGLPCHDAGCDTNGSVLFVAKHDCARFDKESVET